MEQYIPKSVLVAEIDNILDYADEHWDTDYAIGEQRFADKLQDTIDTLEVKEVDLDFEQELYKAFGQVKDFTLGMRIAKYFFELGMQVSDKAQKGKKHEV